MPYHNENMLKAKYVLVIIIEVHARKWAQYSPHTAWNEI